MKRCKICGGEFDLAGVDVEVRNHFSYDEKIETSYFRCNRCGNTNKYIEIERTECHEDDWR